MPYMPYSPTQTALIWVSTQASKAEFLDISWAWKESSRVDSNFLILLKPSLDILGFTYKISFEYSHSDCRSSALSPFTC